MKRHPATLDELLFLGIEGGGTRTVALLADARGRLRQRVEAGPANMRLLTDAQLVALFRELERTLPLPAAIGVSMAGVRDVRDERRLVGLAGMVWPNVPCRATHDLESALAAAEAPTGGGSARFTGARVIVLSGTGSCCFGRSPRGPTVKVGGWGHVIGDKGSGYEIGLRALKAVVYYLDRDRHWSSLGRQILRVLQLNEPNDLIGWAQTATKHEIAALALEVFTAWQRHERIATDILTGAAGTLAKDAVSCARRLARRGERVEFFFAGSVLLRQPRFQRLVARQIRALWPRAVCAPLPRESAWGAVALARELFNSNSDLESRSNVVGTARCAVPARAERADETLQDPRSRRDSFRAAEARGRSSAASLPTSDCGFKVSTTHVEHQRRQSSPGTIHSATHRTKLGGDAAMGSVDGAAPVVPETACLPPTEERNPRSMKLDRLTTAEAIRLMLREEARVPVAVLAETKSLERALRLIVRALRGGGRLFYVGAGTSGRLGVLDASECPPTFGTPSDQVQGIIAGGQRALWQAVEGAEDDAMAGGRTMEFRGAINRDVVVGIAASGRTPFVWGALAEARRRGARTVLVTFNPHLKFARGQKPDVVIAPETGPEILTGSTRLKAGTATKLILNTLTTVAMVRLGRVRSNLMVDVNASNAKLRARAVRMVCALTGAAEGAARAALVRVGWKVQAAVARIERGK